MVNKEKIIKVFLGKNSRKKVISRKILNAISRELKISDGETTADGKFKLEVVDCTDFCEIAPLIKIDETFYGNIDTVDALALISHEKQKSED